MYRRAFWDLVLVNGFVVGSFDDNLVQQSAYRWQDIMPVAMRASLVQLSGWGEMGRLGGLHGMADTEVLLTGRFDREVNIRTLAT